MQLISCSTGLVTKKFKHCLILDPQDITPCSGDATAVLLSWTNLSLILCPQAHLHPHLLLLNGPLA